MKKIITTTIVLCMLFAVVSCGGNGSNSDDNGDTSVISDENMVRYENDRISFLIPKDWESQDMLFRDPPRDLVRAGVEVVFYPKDQKFDDLLEPLSTVDYRYVEGLELGKRTLVIFMKGTTTRYYFNGTDNPRVTFYEGTIDDYQKHTVQSGDTVYDACSVFLNKDAAKSDIESLMYVMYGDRQPMADMAIASFYGIAVVSENIGSYEKELFNKIISSFEYKTR